MKWHIYVTTERGRFLGNWFGYKTKKEAEHFAEQFRKVPGTIKVEVVKA